MLQTIITIAALFILWSYRAPIFAIITQALGMTSKVMDVGEAHLNSWKDDAELSAQINSERKRQTLKEELDKVNAQREADGKVRIEMPD